MTCVQTPVESDVFITRHDSSQLTSQPSIWREAKPVKASGLFNQHADISNSNSDNIILQSKLKTSLLLSSKKSRFRLRNNAIAGSKPVLTRFVISLDKREKRRLLSGSERLPPLR